MQKPLALTEKKSLKGRPQKVADALWTLKEQKGDQLKAHGITLRQAIEAWDEIILRATSYDRPVHGLRNKST